MAEREGFEPSVRLPVHMISNHAHSTTLSPLRWSASKVPVARVLSRERQEHSERPAPVNTGNSHLLRIRISVGPASSITHREFRSSRRIWIADRSSRPAGLPHPHPAPLPRKTAQRLHLPVTRNAARSARYARPEKSVVRITTRPHIWPAPAAEAGSSAAALAGVLGTGEAVPTRCFPPNFVGIAINRPAKRGATFSHSPAM